jgi:photosystem II stability/assembly factor-like uncharacterized protein
MKKKLLLSTLTLLIIIVVVLISHDKQTEFEKKQKEYATYLANHSYSNRTSLTRKELEAIPKKDRPDLAFEQDFLKTIDPNTKMLHQERLVKALNYGVQMKKEATASKKVATAFNWESRGPKTVSGRVRAMMFDPNDENSKRVFSGGVSGGIWKNEDISDENSSWTIVYPEMSNFAISSIEYDPVQKTTFYIGTGEGWGNIGAVNGAGIWKSIDSGANWGNLSYTTDFEYVYDIIVRDEGGSKGVIYAAMRDANGGKGSGIFKSLDGGISWINVFSNQTRDLELASDNTIWAGGARGEVYNSSNGTSWNTSYTSSLNSLGRVELATAPSNTDVIYGLIASNNALGEVIKTTDGGANWVASGVSGSGITEPSDVSDSSIPIDDFTRGQAWYDLIAKVSPTNENELFVGGINVFKTLDAGASWFKISSWDAQRDNSVPFVHADIHGMEYRPNFDEILISTDGGIFYSNRASELPFSSLVARNLNFNVTQFYSGAIDPVNQNGFLGGAQDNGTNAFSETGISNTEELLGGDGGFSFIDQTAIDSERSLYSIASTQFNNYFLFDYASGSSRRISLITTGNASFINPADYDDENNILYSNNDDSTISRAKLRPDFENQGSGSIFLGVTDVVQVPSLQGVDVTHIRVSAYNKSLRKVLIGSAVGTLVQLNGADDSSIPRNTPNITAAISCVEIGASDDEILLTYSNYGVKSVWYTSDAGANWKDVEGNLPDIPVRWSLFNPLNRKEVVLATEAGIWMTNDVTATNVVWEPAASGMGSVRVDMLQYRASDNLVLAATHGRGMFTTNFTEATASIDEIVSIENKFFTVYPTISKGSFTIFAENYLGKAKMNIFDISGREVHKKNLDFSLNEKQKVSIHLNSGVYFINLVDENGKKSSKKFLVE